MVGQLPPAVTSVSGEEELICFVNGVPKTITSSQIALANEAALPFVLQWAVWFNGTPGISELLALYVSPVDYLYPANFTGSESAAPITNPAAAFVLDVDRQFLGTGAWNNIGTISVSTGGVVTFATLDGNPVPISIGDRLRVVGPVTPDSAITGFAATLKGAPNT